VKRCTFGRPVKERQWFSKKEASMMRRSLQRVLTPEEHRLVRIWTLGVLIFYGAIALAALGVVGLHLHFVDGSMTAVTTAATSKDQSNH
jgi:hypothetical protein